MQILVAPDKFRGTLDARSAIAAMTKGASQPGCQVRSVALSDGGEGFGDCIGGSQRIVTVAGPLRGTVEAPIRFPDPTTAVIEMADAAGRRLMPRPQGGDPLKATTTGVGEMITSAIDMGATTVVVGCGGSATTDGGRGAVEAIEANGGLRDAVLIVATDVTATFLDAATTFGPQKGASPAQVLELRDRLASLADRYHEEHGIDVRSLERSGAAGGLAGGLAAIGGRLVSGFNLVAERVGLDRALDDADLVISGEGHLDATSLEGKVVGSLLARTPAGCDVLVVVGQADPDVREALSQSGTVTVIDLSDTFGRARSERETGSLVEDVVATFVATRLER